MLLGGPRFEAPTRIADEQVWGSAVVGLTTHAKAFGWPMILRLNGLKTHPPLGRRFPSTFQMWLPFDLAFFPSALNLEIRSWRQRYILIFFADMVSSVIPLARSSSWKALVNA